jgi:hypothetical protein
MNIQRSAISAIIGLGISALAAPAFASNNGCSSLPSWTQLKTALIKAVATGNNNGGLGNNMWAVLVSVDGTVCAVAFSGSNFTSQWLGSRVIAAQKANTANDFSLSNGSSLTGTGLVLSTANLYSAVQPGGSLYGLQHSNPVDPTIAYEGNALLYGTPHDPLVGQRVGGVNVFGGGLALYSAGGTKLGAVGVSGDQSCTDHFVAWHVRHNLNLDHLAKLGVVPGADPQHPDNIIFDITPNPQGGTGISASGFGHPTCVNTGNPASLPAVSP